MNEIDNFLWRSETTSAVTSNADGYSLSGENLLNYEVYDEYKEDGVGEVMVEVVGSEVIVNGVNSEGGSWNWDTEDGEEYKGSREETIELTNIILEVEEGESKINLNVDESNSRHKCNPVYPSSIEDTLSLLHNMAEEPKKEGGHNFSSNISMFLSDYRNSISAHFPGRQRKYSGKKRKVYSTNDSHNQFEYDESTNAYWEEKTVSNALVVSLSANGCVDDVWRSYENGPAELVLNFSEGNLAPSETSLNKMFKRFGPLQEQRTRVDGDRSRASVVFKKLSDAEVALSSSRVFKIFGPVMMVNYELNYTPLVPIINLPFEDATLIKDEDGAGKQER